MKEKYKRLKYACYGTSFSMSVAANLSAILFLTFRNLYGISYSKLGLLVLINFVTQLLVDLVFSFFSHKFNMEKTVKSTPLFIVSGLWVYAVFPKIFPQHIFLGLVIGTVLFSAGSGLGEVLMSPVIASIPSDEPDREMSKLDSVYAWGVVVVVIFSTVFLRVFGSGNWYILAVILSAIPLAAFILYTGTDVPKMETPEKVSGVLKFIKNKKMWLYVAMIFFGGASEITMAQWSSGFLEKGLGVPKIYGDIFGVALFSVMLGLGRSFYAKKGKNITKVLLVGIVSAAVCYFVVAVNSNPFLGIMACALTGLCVSMLWPGSLIASSDNIPHGGVFLYAFMAAGGDLGASVAPQLVGIITDTAMANPQIIEFAQNIGTQPEQLGIKIAMFVGMLFPLCAIPIYFVIHKNSVAHERIRQV